MGEGEQNSRKQDFLHISLFLQARVDGTAERNSNGGAGMMKRKREAK